MALRWLIHSAGHIVLGHPNDTNLQPKPQENVNTLKVSNGGNSDVEMYPSGFRMPLHYPRYTKADYEKMEEWKVDLLLQQYGLRFQGSLDEKRAYAMGAFLWPDQY